MKNTNEVISLNQNNILNLAGIIRESFVDGPGIRYVVFTQGCPHNCNGCHNPDSHSFDVKNKISIDSIYRDMLKNPLIDGLTLSGGEPFCQGEALARLCEKCHEKKLNVITYTGYTIEQLLGNMDNPNVHDLLYQTDILVDGKFVLEEKSLMLRFRGSRNQRIIDVPKTLENMSPVFIDWDNY